MSQKIEFFKNEEQKVKFRLDKTLMQVITGQIVIQRRTLLPCLSIGTGGVATLNKSGQALTKNFKKATFYKLKNGMILVEFSEVGAVSLSRHTQVSGYKACTIAITNLKKYIFNELKNPKLIYHFYLHPTDKANTYLLQELTNSWE